jgi:RNA polymerase sigma-70 factor (ECF subfamily)
VDFDMVVRNGAMLRPVDGAVAHGSGDWSGEEFDVLYRRYFPRLVSMCRRRVGDEALAEDVAQETLLRALTHLEQLDGGRPLWPWLKTTATNIIIDHARKQARIVSCEEPGERPCEAGPSVEETDLLRQAIKSLPGRQRTAVALRYINDWDSQDAASFLGVTRPAYEQLLFRARRRLQVEYRRLATDVFGGVAVGSAFVRKLFRKAAGRLRQAGANVAPLGELTSFSASQIAGGALALMVTLGAQPAPVAAGAAAPHMHPVVQRRLGAGGHRKTAAARSERAAQQGSLRSSHAGAVAAGFGPNEQRTSKRPLLTQLTGEDVNQPEDAHITSIAMSPNFAHDGVVFASGRSECPQYLCSNVLFKSTDAGATWTRLPATTFNGEDVLVPPGFDENHQRIFAMGSSGLQVSEDGGETFAPAATTTATYVVGAAAISPAFANGDPSILIGSQTLMRYRDDTGTVEPVPSNTGTGPLAPAFAPDYPADDRIVVGGLALDADSGRLVSAVHTCRASLCNTAFVGSESLPATVRLAPDFARSNLAYAFTASGLFASDDGGASFRQLLKFETGAFVHDVAVTPDGRLYVASGDDQAGLYESSDGGTTWTKVASPLFDGGANRVVVAGNLVIASLGDRGLACSIDGGATWAPRCGS